MIGELNDYANVIDYGARPNSFLDDTEAFEKALASGNSVYVPTGIYYVSKTLKIENQNFVGMGCFMTQIVSINTDKNSPIIMAGRSCKIADLLIKYKEGIVTGDEKEGERVGIYACSDNWPLQRCSSISNIHIDSVGTCLYLPRDYLGGGPFCVEHSNLELNNFSFRGIDYGAKHRIGNIFSNIFIESRMESVDCAFYFDGDCTNVTMNEIVVLYTRCRRAALSFNNVKGFQISSIHIGGVSITEPNHALIELNNSSGEIGSFSCNYIPLEAQNLSVFRFLDASYDLCVHDEIEAKPCNHHLRIGNFDVCGLNDPSCPDSYPNFIDKGLIEPQKMNFTFFSRKSDCVGNYYVTIGNYAYFTFQDDVEFYEDFPCDDDRIVFLKKGELPPGGSTKERPKHRLCRYVSEYFDTDLGKKVTWDGEKWV